MKKQKAWLYVMALGLMVVLPLKGIADVSAIVWYEPVVEIVQHVLFVSD